MTRLNFTRIVHRTLGQSVSKIILKIIQLQQRWNGQLTDFKSCNFSSCAHQVKKFNVLTLLQRHLNYFPIEMSRLMRKPTICICENKDADQLRGNHKADQRLCFRYMDSTIPLLLKYKISSFEPSSVTVQLCLCQTCSETTLLVFPGGGSNVSRSTTCFPD